MLELPIKEYYTYDEIEEVYQSVLKNQKSFKVSKQLIDYEVLEEEMKIINKIKRKAKMRSKIVNIFCFIKKYFYVIIIENIFYIIVGG